MQPAMKSQGPARTYFVPPCPNQDEEPCSTMNRSPQRAVQFEKRLQQNRVTAGVARVQPSPPCSAPFARDGTVSPATTSHNGQHLTRGAMRPPLRGSELFLAKRRSLMSSYKTYSLSRHLLSTIQTSGATAESQSRG